MKVFKPTFTDRRTGKKKRCRHWYATFTDNRQIRRRLPLFADKRASERTAQNIEQLLSCGGVMTPELLRWLESVPVKQRNKLVEWQIIDSQRVSANIGKPLLEHVADYEQFLLSKGDTPSYAKWVRGTLERTFSACHFRYFSDIDANAVAVYLKDRRDSGTGQRTSNSYLTAAKGFCTWGIKTQRTIGPNPLDYLGPVKQTEIRRQRRAIEVDEVLRLLRTTKAGPERFGMAGTERALLYRVAIESGLRVNELRSLTVSSFDLKACTVTVQAAYSKRRRQDVLPVKPETVAELRAFFAGKLPSLKAFGGRYKKLTDRTAQMIKQDLTEAGLEYCEDGKFFDFHSQRHETATLLAASGVDVKTAQSLLRHSDVNLTMTVYSHTLRGSEAKAVAKLPDLSTDKQEQKKLA